MLVIASVVPPLIRIAPPSTLASFPLKIVLVIASVVPPLIKIAPPLPPSAELLVNVLLATVTNVPSL